MCDVMISAHHMCKYQQIPYKLTCFHQCENSLKIITSKHKNFEDHALNSSKIVRKFVKIM